MTRPEQLHCLFSARVKQQDGSYIVEIPERELEIGSITDGSTYRIAVLSSTANPEDTSDDERPDSVQNHGPPEPPVAENDRLEVEIEDIGSQGDGIARVERGFVIIVPDTDKGERVTVKVTEVQENVAFAEVQERQTHF